MNYSQFGSFVILLALARNSVFFPSALPLPVRLLRICICVCVCVMAHSIWILHPFLLSESNMCDNSNGIQTHPEHNGGAPFTCELNSTQTHTHKSPSLFLFLSHFWSTEQIYKLNTRLIIWITVCKALSLRISSSIFKWQWECWEYANVCVCVCARGSFAFGEVENGKVDDNILLRIIYYHRVVFEF